MNQLKKMTKSRGQTLLSVIMWASGISLTAGLAFLGFTNATIDKVDDQVFVNTQRLSTLEAESKQYHEDISRINTKLDAIAEKLNVKYIERSLASSTSSK